MLGQIAEAQ